LSQYLERTRFALMSPRGEMRAEEPLAPQPRARVTAAVAFDQIAQPAPLQQCSFDLFQVL
jgi:hypothetical protein